MANAPKKKRCPPGGFRRRSASRPPWRRSTPSCRERSRNSPPRRPAEIQQSFRTALEKGVVEVARGFRQSQDRGG